MFSLSKCPVCGGSKRTPVLEFNGLVALDRMRERPLARYEYMLCHRCGVVYASRRPGPDELAYLYQNFSEFLGRPEAPDLIDDPRPLTDALRAEIDSVAIPWWELGDKEPSPGDRYCKAAQTYMRVYRPHVEMIAKAIDVSGMRILDVRSKIGYVGTALARNHGAREVCMTVMFPTQEYIVKKLYHAHVRRGVNFEEFEAPFEGVFDLIILTHMLTHALDLRGLLASAMSRLAPSGYLYLCQENDDTRLFERGKNLFTEMKAFHFQQFDAPSLQQALERCGLSVVALGHPSGKTSFGALAKRRKTWFHRCAAVPTSYLSARKRMYRQWRDESALSLSAEAQAALADLPEIQARSLADGYALIKDDRVMPKRKIRMLHAKGYEALNATPV